MKYANASTASRPSFAYWPKIATIPSTRSSSRWVISSAPVLILKLCVGPCQEQQRSTHWSREARRGWWVAWPLQVRQRRKCEEDQRHLLRCHQELRWGDWGSLLCAQPHQGKGTRMRKLTRSPDEGPPSDWRPNSSDWGRSIADRIVSPYFV